MLVLLDHHCHVGDKSTEEEVSDFALAGLVVGLASECAISCPVAIDNFKTHVGLAVHNILDVLALISCHVTKFIEVNLCSLHNICALPGLGV